MKMAQANPARWTTCPTCTQPWTGSTSLCLALSRHRLAAELDDEPEHFNAELGRQGYPPKPVWAVTFWIVAKDGEGGFERRTAVEIHADTGEVLKIHSDP